MSEESDKTAINTVSAIMCKSLKELDKENTKMTTENAILKENIESLKFQIIQVKSKTIEVCQELEDGHAEEIESLNTENFEITRKLRETLESLEERNEKIEMFENSESDHILYIRSLEKQVRKTEANVKRLQETIKTTQTDIENTRHDIVSYITENQTQEGFNTLHTLARLNFRSTLTERIFKSADDEIRNSYL